VRHLEVLSSLVELSCELGAYADQGLCRKQDSRLSDMRLFEDTELPPQEWLPVCLLSLNSGSAVLPELFGARDHAIPHCLKRIEFCGARVAASSDTEFASFRVDTMARVAVRDFPKFRSFLKSLA